MGIESSGTVPAHRQRSVSAGTSLQLADSKLLGHGRFCVIHLCLLQNVGSALGLEKAPEHAGSMKGGMDKLLCVCLGH